MALKKAPFKDLEVKRAVDLAVETGLRRGDVLNLKWENIKKSGGRYYLSFTIQKTGYKVRLPLSQEAVAVLGTIKKKGSIFPTLSTPVLNHKVPQLIAAAGINKHITFHCFRHTFAMRLLDKGVDIPTIAFLLGHKFLAVPCPTFIVREITLKKSSLNWRDSTLLLLKTAATSIRDDGSFIEV